MRASIPTTTASMLVREALLVHYTRPFVDLLDWQAGRRPLRSQLAGLDSPGPRCWQGDVREPCDRRLRAFSAWRRVGRIRPPTCSVAIPAGRCSARLPAPVDAHAVAVSTLVVTGPDLLPATGKPPSAGRSPGRATARSPANRCGSKLWQDGPDGPAFLALIAAAAPDTGSYDWAPEDTAIAPGSHRPTDQSCRMRRPPHVSDMSAEPFSVPEDTSDYFVAPSVHEGGTGDNRNTGRARGRTKAEPGELSADLRPGDRRHAFT